MIEKSTEHPTVFDTDQQQLGVIYAKALLSHGKQTGLLDQLVEQLDAVVNVIREVPGFQAALESPRIPFEAKAKLIDKAFAGKVDRSLVNFLKVVGSKRRFDCLPAISSSAKKMQDEIAGRVQAVLTSATEIDESVKAGIASRLSAVLGKTVSLKSTVDPKIIGGMVVRVGDTVYDGSVVNQLAQIRTRAVKRASDAIREKLERFATN